MLTQPAPSARTLTNTGVRVSIVGLGHYLPTSCITNDDLSKLVDTTDEWIVPRTGIQSRHRASPAEATSDLAANAAINALADARIAAADIDLLVVATATPDSPVPSTASLVLKRLGIERAAAMDLSAACAGFVFAVHTASGLLRAGMHHRALVIGAETLTRMTNYADRQSCILFGDGAGAVVLGTDTDTVAPTGAGGGRRYELVYSRIATEPRHGDLIRVIAGGSRRPASEATVRDQEHYLTLQGAEVFKRAVECMVLAGREALEDLGLQPNEVRWVIPHQANLRIMNAVADRLGASKDQLVTDIATVGNTSAASLPLALSRLRGRGQPSVGDKVMLLTFGAGVTWGCQVYVTH